MSRILNPNFRYVPAAATDIRKTIARERKRLAAEQALEEEARRAAETQASNVAPITTRRRGTP